MGCKRLSSVPLQIHTEPFQAPVTRTPRIWPTNSPLGQFDNLRKCGELWLLWVWLCFLRFQSFHNALQFGRKPGSQLHVNPIFTCPWPGGAECPGAEHAVGPASREEYPCTRLNGQGQNSLLVIRQLLIACNSRSNYNLLKHISAL